MPALLDAVDRRGVPVGDPGFYTPEPVRITAIGGDILQHHLQAFHGIMARYDYTDVCSLCRLHETQHPQQRCLLGDRAIYAVNRKTNPMTEPGLDIVCTHRVNLKDVAYLLISAYEGGSNYWARIDKYRKPPKLDFKFDDSPDVHFQRINFPFCRGGGVLISDARIGEIGHKTRKRWLTLKSIKKGLELMAKTQPRHWADFVTDNADAETGDVFLQLCLFGEVTFG